MTLQICFSSLAGLLLAITCNATVAIGQSLPVYPGRKWETAKPADVGLDAKLLQKARDYALTGGGSGMIVRRGKVVITWGDQKKRYDLKSTTKSIGMTAVGLAIKDGKLKLEDRVQKHHPKFGVPPESNRKSRLVE